MQGRSFSLFPAVPHSANSPLTRKALAFCGLVFFNCLVGLSYWVSHRDEAVLPYLVVANAIGLSAMLLSSGMGKLMHGSVTLLLKVIVVAPVSVLVGFEIAASTVGHLPHLIDHASFRAWFAHGSSFVVAGVACAFFSVFMQAARMRASLEIQRREAAEARQTETAARLALLQAQIEPHFLFNTLANVQSLIERDPARASTMLDSLNRYLRGSLSRTRKATSTLGEELELVEALLKIASIRLGERLTYAIDVPASLRERAFSPLLLQPLVENALLHGIEPSIEGGEIRIRGARRGGTLELSVIDTGVGLGSNNESDNGNGSHACELHGGVGLANVAARVRSLYGERGRVYVGENVGTEHGVVATLLIPID
jgi:sensor histidine kinase YesM